MDENNNTGSFDEAMARAQDIFEHPELYGDVGGEAPPEEGDVGGEAPPEEQEPVATPEPQAEPVAQEPTPVQQPQVDPYQAQMQALQQQLMESQQQQQAIMQQNAQLQNMVHELSEKNKEKVVEETIEMPVLDIGRLAFEDEDAIRDAQLQYAQQMGDYIKAVNKEDLQSFRQQLQPLLDEAKRGEIAREEQAFVDSVSQYPEMADLGDLMPAMRNLMERAPIFNGGDASTNERLMSAYIMQKGIDAITHPPEEPKAPTVEELMGIYDSNPDFRAAVEQKRIAAVKDGMQVPPSAASSGAANAALQIKDAPKNFDDADEIVRGLFR